MSITPLVLLRILPQAVEVTLVMDDFAELTRLFLVSKETAE